MEYAVILNDYVLNEDYLWYSGTDPLKALEIYLFLLDDDDPDGGVTLQKTNRQKVDKRNRWFKKHPPICPPPNTFVAVETDELPF
jgi:hypothetical protein